MRRCRSVRLLLPGCFCRTCFDGGSLKMRSGITRLPDRPASERSGGLNGCGAAYSCAGVLAGYCCRDGPFHAKESRRCIAEMPKHLCRWRDGRDALSGRVAAGIRRSEKTGACGFSCKGGFGLRQARFGRIKRRRNGVCPPDLRRKRLLRCACGGFRRNSVYLRLRHAAGAFADRFCGQAG